jgi:hypothetical protein
MYEEKKKLSSELVKYMSRELRPRYKEVMSNFYTKYETHHSGKTHFGKVEVKPKNVKAKIDEIAKRRAELKKLAKKEEIDSKLKQSAAEDTEEGKEEHTDKACVVCYKAEGLYVSKCGHYACKGCWDQWLQRYLECPQCRSRVRKNQIVPLSQEVVFRPN